MTSMSLIIVLFIFSVSLTVATSSNDAKVMRRESNMAQVAAHSDSVESPLGRERKHMRDEDAEAMDMLSDDNHEVTYHVDAALTEGGSKRWALTEKQARTTKEIEARRAKEAALKAEASALQKGFASVAEAEFAALGLTDSDIDPDANLKTHQKDAFQVRVVVPGGDNMCLSETHHGYHVQAIKCVNGNTHGQQWYWEKKALKNLNSNDRCLGYAISQKEEHRLSMYPCTDDSLYTNWLVDEHSGSLKAEETGRCMAFQADYAHNAVTLPCESA